MLMEGGTLVSRVSGLQATARAPKQASSAKLLQHRNAVAQVRPVSALLPPINFGLSLQLIAETLQMVMKMENYVCCTVCCRAHHHIPKVVFQQHDQGFTVAHPGHCSAFVGIHNLLDAISLGEVALCSLLVPIAQTTQDTMVCATTLTPLAGASASISVIVGTAVLITPRALMYSTRARSADTSVSRVSHNSGEAGKETHQDNDDSDCEEEQFAIIQLPTTVMYMPDAKFEKVRASKDTP